jgi:hypothetical protein
MGGRPIVVWWCQVFDRQTKQLPLGRKTRILDWSRTPIEKANKVIAALSRADANKASISPEGFDEVVETFTIEISSYLNIAEFREYFDDIAEADLTAEIEKCDGEFGFRRAPFDPDYVEDETGTPTSHLEIIEAIHGVKDPIIYGDAKSVLRREFKEPLRVGDWSVESSNVCAHFIEVVQQIYRSQWLQTPPRISFVGDKSTPSRLAEMRVPGVEQTMAILAFIRQLFADHKQDSLFEATCEIFARHCGDQGKVHWINERVASFSSRLNQSPGFFNLGGRTCLDVLNMFLYGAGLMHAKPHSHFREDDKLASAISEFGRERVVAAFHFTLHSVMEIPFSALRVIGREYQHWIENCGMAKPTRVQLLTLFSNVELSEE